MRLDFAYRLLCHATLAVSCASLLYSEEAIIPGMEWGVIPALLLVALAFLLQGRWALPRWLANVLALCSVVAVGWWFSTQMRDPESWVHYLTPTAALVPHLGPVLVVLLLVKLFRAHGPGDFWQLQGIGLVQMTLASLLATQPFFALLLLAYLLCGLATLAAHYLRDRPAGAAVAAPAGQRPPGLVPLGATSLKWSLFIATPAMLLFLVTPRPPDSWDPLQTFVYPPTRTLQVPKETGVSDRMDLTSTGTVEQSDELAFSVFATDAQDQPKLDLSPEQRWRGPFLDVYENGVWTSLPRSRTPGPIVAPAGLALPRFEKPFYLTYSVQPQQAGGLFLADPVVLRRGGLQQPVVQLAGPAGIPLFVERLGALVPTVLTGRECRYRQILPEGEDPDWVVAWNLYPQYVQKQLIQLPSSPANAAAELRRFTQDLLRRLAAEGKYGLSAGHLSLGPARRESWEMLGRALASYLTYSGEYTYTLEQRRQDTRIDPTLDFLRNVKQGHCERFAGGLALMLRSVGVPARIVKGYRGAESQGNGSYLVRQKFAHSWVEILIPFKSRMGFKWLALDPTPGGVPPPPQTTSLKRWWEENQQLGMVWLRRLIVDYDPRHVSAYWQKLSEIEGWKFLVFLPAALGGVGLILVLRRAWRARRGRRSARSAIAFHARLLALLQRYLHLTPAPGQTARELAGLARPALAVHPDTAPVASVPSRLVDLFYRVRFGEQTLAEPERQEVEADLERLEAALRSARARS